MADLTMTPEMRAQVEAQAGRLFEAGEFEKAGMQYVRLGDERRAAAAYQKAGQDRKAAECALRANAYAAAGELYTRAGEHLLAAKAYTQGREAGKAAAAYEAAGKLEEAARMYMLSHEFLKAGELYEKLGDPMRSALAYEQVMAKGEAATPKSPEEMTRMAQILERVKQFEKAAQIYMQMQQVNEALMTYLRAGDLPGAARLYASCQGNVGWEVFEVARREGPEALKKVAEMFYFAKDFDRAGEAFLAAGDVGKAAASYDAGGDAAAAAECYARAGMTKEAARAYEKCGHYDRAAQLWRVLGEDEHAAQSLERAGEGFGAGELYLKLGHLDRAVEQFQRVPDTDPHFLESVDHVARILKEKGYVDLAVERYKAVIRKAGLTEDTLPLHYHLALILLERGAAAEARDLLRSVSAFRFGYRDAEALLKQAEERLAKVPAAPAAAPATPAPAAASQPEARPAGGEHIQRVRGLEVLQEAALFQELTLAELRVVMSAGQTKEVAKDERLIRAGESGRAVHILLEGMVKVTRGEHETEEILAALVPGEHFGEMSLLDDAPTSAHVTTLEPSLLFSLDRTAMEGLLGGDPRLAVKLYRVFVRTLSQRLRKVNEELAGA